MHDFSQNLLAPAFIYKHFSAQMDKTTTKIMKKNYSQKDICIFEIAYSTRMYHYIFLLIVFKQKRPGLKLQNEFVLLYKI